MSSVLENFGSLPLVGIIRGCADEHLPHLLDASQRGGMLNLEITMNSPGAERQIRQAASSWKGHLNIGAGTVTSVELLDRALAAGASFIVTPLVIPEVISKCVAGGIPVFPGAFTPTEIHRAWELGATMVKLFPAEFGGPNFVRGIKAPFPEIQLMPTGGVDLNTIADFLQAGASGFGIGSPLFRKDRIESRDWPWIQNQVSAFVRTYRQHAAPQR